MHSLSSFPFDPLFVLYFIFLASPSPILVCTDIPIRLHKSTEPVERKREEKENGRRREKSSEEEDLKLISKSSSPILKEGSQYSQGRENGKGSKGKQKERGKEDGSRKTSEREIIFDDQKTRRKTKWKEGEEIALGEGEIGDNPVRSLTAPSDLGEPHMGCRRNRPSLQKRGHQFYQRSSEGQLMPAFTSSTLFIFL